jgi:surfeit locus 1 family protein
VTTASVLTRRRALIVLAATLLGVALTARLGVWQLDRAAQKEALQHSLEQRAAMPELPASALAQTAHDAAAQHDRHIHVQGRWIDSATIFLENRQMNGRPGFYVVTPLVLSGSGDTVLVQRGWAPRDAGDRTHVPVLPVSTGPVSVQGRIAPPPARLFEFSAAASGAIRQNLDLAEYGHELSRRLLPVSIVQDTAPEPDDGLLRQWPHPAADIQMHLGYAFQWFALCALMAGLYVWFQLIRPRLRRAA